MLCCQNVSSGLKSIDRLRSTRNLLYVEKTSYEKFLDAIDGKMVGCVCMTKHFNLLENNFSMRRRMLLHSMTPRKENFC